VHNFFVSDAGRDGEYYRITGADFNHIVHVLRMRQGERFYVSCDGMSFLCELDSIGEDAVRARILEAAGRSTELPVHICLFQGLPKSDKMEWIIQKAVELGAAEIVPVEMSRCIVRLEEKKKAARRERWQSIAESAAKQSKRSRIPTVGEVLTFPQALERGRNMDVFLVPYENEEGMAATKRALAGIRPGSTVGILIGPEGGFDEQEAAAAAQAGGSLISLGSRILRTETAAITAVGMCMLYAETEL